MKKKTKPQRTPKPPKPPEYEKYAVLAEDGMRAYRRFEEAEDSKTQAFAYRSAAAACMVMAKRIREFGKQLTGR